MQNNLHTFVILAYKESPFLEDCIKSVLNQTSPSTVLIATTTPNAHIRSLAAKYHLHIVKGTHTNIGGDFDFAVHSATTPLATIAHQDDIYNQDYSQKITEAYHRHPDSSIIFTDYYEIRHHQKIYTNSLLKIKRILLSPIRFKKSFKSKHSKRLILKFGNAISCPTVTFVTKNCPKDIFKSDFKCNVDWHAWEKLSKKKGAFTYIPRPLMGHRISEDSTTTDIINQGIRTKEDYAIFKRFWPTTIAKCLTKFYQKSEKSNSLESE
ncbi:glycosyltransferase family 2 protein [Candidatus Saccharibacteria bacterium]|nr:glycosyltransferase family 2 protein [Candidatus Saccharibacteria bacterium]